MTVSRLTAPAARPEPPVPGGAAVPRAPRDTFSAALAVAPSAALRGAHTPLTLPEAARHLGAAWREVTGREPAPATVATLTAQWALETGRGRSMRGWNFAGIKGRSAEGGSARFMTREGHGATERHQVDTFRTYGSAEAGARDYVALLARRFPRSFAAAEAGDARRFGRELGREGWYTDDAARYSEGVHSIAQEVLSGRAELAAALQGAPRVEAPRELVHGLLWMLASRMRRG